MDKNYSLNLPDWGPYNKVYLGASHIADKEKGLRFDINLFPGYFRRSVMSVRDVADCGTKMMGASKKLTKFLYRYELEWKDRVYVDANYTSENNVITIKCDFVNNTDLPESLSLNGVMGMKGCSAYHREILPCRANAEDGVFIDAVDYDEISSEQKIASDGLYLCEGRESGFTGGSFIDSKLFGKKGDYLKYSFENVSSDKIGIRYRGEGKVILKLNSREYVVNLPYSEEINLYYVDVEKGNFSALEVYPVHSRVDFDGFVFGENVLFSEICDYFVPEYEKTKSGVKIKFKDKEYVVETDCDNFVIRKLECDDIYNLLTSQIHNHVEERIGDGGHEYIDLFIRPVFVEANSKKTVTIKITAPKSKEFLSEEGIEEPLCNFEGEKYKFSQKIMRAVTLSNVVWPIYSRRGYILHNTPGRNWDSLYTWDSGFIGMGLSEIDIQRATECLNAYLTPKGDIHSPFILHGSPIPTQIFLYNEIFQKTGDKEFLEKFYPEIYQQYRFFADMRKKKSIKNGLFALWDVFYNSGGWDDYPPQKYVHENNLENEACPVINTAITVLFGKILKNLGEISDKDTREIDEDINFYSKAVECLWDEESGYYGYSLNDKILKIDSVNGNMGMDGVFPMIAGISDSEKTERMFKNIKEGMITSTGVSVVDTRAPYFRDDGYWNGSVWMPHQWILWKGCLDNGEGEMARQIAETALALWERETAKTYNCYEHFMISNGRGCGYHQFSGLSTPVLMWFSAYFMPYTVTSGFMTTITDKKMEENKFSFKIKSTSRKPVVIVCLPEDEKFEIKTKGRVNIEGGVYRIDYNSEICDMIEITIKG